MSLRKVGLLLLAAGLSCVPWATVAAETHGEAGRKLIGIWLTEDKEGAVQIYPCGTALCGRLYWIKPSDEENAAFDDKNSDPALRSRPLCGLEFMGGFIPQADGSYGSGWIYSPRHGTRFNARVSPGPREGTIELRGYFLVPLLGESQIWTRAEKQEPCVPPEERR